MYYPQRISQAGITMPTARLQMEECIAAVVARKYRMENETL